MRVAAIVPAAGRGRRLGGRIRKPFVRLGGRPLLAHTLRALQRARLVDCILVAARPEDGERIRRLSQRFRITKAIEPCIGGASRAASVAKGLAALPAQITWVVVHDGARPCVSPRLIDAAIRAAQRGGAVACGLPASLTVKAVARNRRVEATLERKRLWFVQTPQVFPRNVLVQALRRAGKRLRRFPDDASIVEAAGFPVRMIPGSPWNIKVTTSEDLIMAETILRRMRR